MDREKLNKAAEDARRASAETLTTFGAQHYIDDVVAITDMKLSYDEVAESAFVKGADWLMQQPLSERLTEAEKENVRTMFSHAQTFYKIDWENGNEDGQAAFWRGQYEGLLAIFGSELFTEK